MKITTTLLDKMSQDIKKYSDGIIAPDGDYVLIKQGHLHSLMEFLPYSEDEIWKMIPADDSALFWLIEKTNCVITDYNSTVGMAMTPQQKKVFHDLVEHKIISDQYYDITNERKKHSK